MRRALFTAILFALAAAASSVLSAAAPASGGDTVADPSFTDCPTQASTLTQKKRVGNGGAWAHV